MNLSDYIADHDRRKALAEACGTTGDWLYQVATEWRGRKAGPDLARAIERETARLGPECVPKESLRPDLWGGEGEVPETGPLARSALG